MESFNNAPLARDSGEEPAAADDQPSRTPSLTDSNAFSNSDTSALSSMINKAAEPDSPTPREVPEQQGDYRSSPAPTPYAESSTGIQLSEEGGDGEDEDPQIAMSFERGSTPTSAQKQRSVFYDGGSEEGINRMHKFSLYETASRFYMVGMDLSDTRFRILKIDRTSETGDLSVAEDDIVYTKREMSQLLDAIDDGNKSSGGLKLKCSAWALLGFIRFTGAYYMLLVTKRSQIAMLGGHYVYQVDGTELISLTTSNSSRMKPDKNHEEARYIAILNNLDLTRSFYFSYSYDITRTLQHNICRERKAHQMVEPVPLRKIITQCSYGITIFSIRRCRVSKNLGNGACQSSMAMLTKRSCLYTDDMSTLPYSPVDLGSLLELAF